MGLGIGLERMEHHGTNGAIGWQETVLGIAPQLATPATPKKPSCLGHRFRDLTPVAAWPETRGTMHYARPVSGFGKKAC